MSTLSGRLLSFYIINFALAQYLFQFGLLCTKLMSV